MKSKVILEKNILIYTQLRFEEMYYLPALFAKDKKGKLRVWDIHSDDDMVYRCSGEVGGKLVTSKRKFQGVNEGRKNQTTAERQAKLECQRKWIKQLTKEYRPDEEDEEGNELYLRVIKLKNMYGGKTLDIAKNFDAIEDGTFEFENEEEIILNSDFTVNFLDVIPRAMLCGKWEDEKKCLKYFPFDQGQYVQPKFDGIRCLAKRVKLSNGAYTVSLITRTGKQFPWLNHIRKALLKIGDFDFTFDGELYASEIFDEEKPLPKQKIFDIISGACRPSLKRPSKFESSIQYHIFDIVDDKLKFKDRLEILNKIPSTNTIRIAPTSEIFSKKEMDKKHLEYTSKGYEGLVIRSKELLYSPNRSLLIRKYKDFSDDEAIILGARVDEGVSEDNFSWECRWKDKQKGKEIFYAKPTGTEEMRTWYYSNYHALIGKDITIRYQEITDKGVPRFPRAIAIRDYE